MEKELARMAADATNAVALGSFLPNSEQQRFLCLTCVHPIIARFESSQGSEWFKLRVDITVMEL
jgi:hypothetical protein